MNTKNKSHTFNLAVQEDDLTPKENEQGTSSEYSHPSEIKSSKENTEFYNSNDPSTWDLGYNILGANPATWYQVSAALRDPFMHSKPPETLLHITKLNLQLENSFAPLGTA